MKITIYSKPDCGACDFVKLWFDNREVKYEEVDAYEDEQAMEALQEHGFRGFPVTAIGSLDDAFIGFDLPRMEKAVEEYRS